MNKKKQILIGLMAVILVVAFIVSSSLTLFKSSDNEIVNNSKREVNNNNFLTFMIEQEDGSYLESTSNTWPGEGYIFNENLSVCENGGELSWNEELGAVNLRTNIADRCFVYFDVYVSPEILEVTASNITSNSITLTVNAIEGTNAIQTYYYSINNGSYTSSSSNNHTFSGLSVGSTYNIRVYVVDSNGI